MDYSKKYHKAQTISIITFIIFWIALSVFIGIILTKIPKGAIEREIGHTIGEIQKGINESN